MIVGAPHIKRIWTVEPEHDPILVVHAHGMEASTVAAERVQPISRRHLQVVEAHDGVDLISLRRTTGQSSLGMCRAALLFTPFQMSDVVSSASVRITA